MTENPEAKGTQDNSAPEGVVMITSLDQFIKMLSAWHANQVELLTHMLEVPEGTEVTTDGGEQISLSGDTRRGFLLGLHTALAEMGELPFITHPQDVPEPTGVTHQLELALQEDAPVQH